MSARAAWLAHFPRLPAGSGPALCALAFGLAAILLRAPLPIDETRYLQVFRENLRGGPLFLSLLGQPYAEKTPLLFWLARALTWLAIPPDVALRAVPTLAYAATVLVTDRLGRRLGLALCGWLLVALWLGSLPVQFLHFDPLVSLAVWAAVHAWSRRSDLAFAAWSAAAFLAKGPVALLFLVPFLWSLAPLRGPRRGDALRTALLLGAALVPLAAWALAAATHGGEAFANALLWERWAGRVAGDVPHARAWYFYLPVVLVGSLPATGFLLLRGAEAERSWSARLGWMLLAILLAFTLIRGKQAHYLEPAVPGLALVLAGRIEERARELVRLRAGVRVQFGLIAGLIGVAALLAPRVAPSVGSRGNALVVGGGLLLPLAIAGALALTGFFLTWLERFTARGLLALASIGVGACMLPCHWLAGQLLFPHELAETLRNGPSEVAYLGTSHHGLYALLAPAGAPEKLDDAAELASWSELHPDSLMLVDAKALGTTVPPGLVVVARDVVHRTPVLVLRRGS